MRGSAPPGSSAVPPPTTAQGPRFVLRPGKPGTEPQFPARLAAQIQVDALQGGSAGWRVQFLRAGLSPASALQKLAKACGPGFQVLPVLAAEDGSERYPTGGLTVRFEAAASDELLGEFARELKLQIIRRTPRTDRQAEFQLPAGSSADVNSVVEAIGQRPGVARAWLDAQSPYRRSD